LKSERRFTYKILHTLIIFILFNIGFLFFTIGETMKKYTYLSIFLILALLLGLVPIGSVAAADKKVDVCHVNGQGLYHLINVSVNALPAHLAHGDGLPGAPVAGNPGKNFTADCSVVEVRTLVDTVTVPSGGSTVPSNISLESGATYELVAGGTYRFAEWGEAGIADARCSFRIPGSFNNTGVNAWVDGAVLPSPVQYYLQLWVNGSPFTWGTSCNTTGHTYTGTYIGTGTTINFKIVDNNYSDNSGFLTVQIYKLN
jgi:hypothetical protein